MFSFVGVLTKVFFVGQQLQNSFSGIDECKANCLHQNECIGLTYYYWNTTCVLFSRITSAEIDDTLNVESDLRNPATINARTIGTNYVELHDRALIGIPIEPSPRASESIHECGKECKALDCEGFSYDSHREVCELFSKIIADSDDSLSTAKVFARRDLVNDACSQGNRRVVGATTQEPTAITGDAESWCPTGWTLCESTKKCYKVGGEYDKPTNYHNARKTCKLEFQQSDLASIHSAEENECIRSLVKDKADTDKTILDKTFLGLTTILKDDEKIIYHYWDDLTPFDYSNWAPNAPSNKGYYVASCAVMTSNGTWNDRPCKPMEAYDIYYYACKVDPTTINF